MTSFALTRLTRMRISAPIQFAAIAAFALAATLPAQSPATPQTNPSASTLPATPATIPPPPQVPLRPQQTPPSRAQVTYTNGELFVSANNSSLNQILRQISSNTGMKVTGGVADERVFGNYGPADPAQVLTSLLDGTATNMILVQRDDASLAELILTPRNGGPTPPNPHAATFDDRPEPQRNFSAHPNPPSDIAPPMQNNSIANPATTTTPTPAGGTQPESPNGVKTPQQIYEQLQRMRQQQQQPQQQPQSQPE